MAARPIALEWRRALRHAELLRSVKCSLLLLLALLALVIVAASSACVLVCLLVRPSALRALGAAS